MALGNISCMCGPLLTLGIYPACVGPYNCIGSWYYILCGPLQGLGIIMILCGCLLNDVMSLMCEDKAKQIIHAGVQSQRLLKSLTITMGKCKR